MVVRDLCYTVRLTHSINRGTASVTISRIVGLALALAAFAVTAVSPRAATPTPDAPIEKGPLVGKLLVATPEMGDPRFAHTVILIVRQNKEGAFGLAINRPVEQRSIASLLDAIGADSKGVDGEARIFAGGPVEPQIGFVIHSAEYRRDETIEIDGRVAVTSSPDIIRDIGLRKGPSKTLIAFGYAGWGPGQLEAELARKDWFTIPEDSKLIFEEDREHVWDIAMSRRTLDL